ncbi:MULTISPECIES: sulfotransferase [Spirulina sp. CCY15215]|uniref:sulfotransferase family protein n=1 Tax=Spirulina sp. CCY15215 TaxID=2767591 RepID=UPI00194E6CEA|nr:sulfotransferase [Spirulina major]
MQDFKFLMLGAMYENGGNTTHRFLDGHPQMFVYPFESQIGTKLVSDRMSSIFPVKYRYPVFSLDATSYQDYKAIIDEEGKVRARTPHVSKFRHIEFDFNDDERCEIYQKYIAETGRSRANNVAAFFKSTFDAWKDYNRTGKEQFYVGYSPIFVVDAPKILEDFPNAHVLHVVRNPWSAYADTKKRPVPHSLADYMLGWTLNQYYALLYQEKYRDRLHIVRAEDVMQDPYNTLGKVCEKLGLERADSLKIPSWNGKPLEEVYPWGTIRKATPEANLATAKELSTEEIEEIRLRTRQYLEVFNYHDFLG